MPTHQQRLSVSMDLARILVRYASDHGVDGLKLWEETGLSPQLLDNLDAYRRIFDCPLKFGHDDNELLLGKNSLDQMVFLANPTLLSGLETMALKHVESLSTVNSVSDKTARAIRRMLIKGEKPFIKQVAKTLGMSTRLLQQKLKNEQTGFLEILDRERMETAIKLLESNQNAIVDITFLLGFSEQSSFTHAFQKWTGKTPGQFREDEILNT